MLTCDLFVLIGWTSAHEGGLLKKCDESGEESDETHHLTPSITPVSNLSVERSLEVSIKYK